MTRSGEGAVADEPNPGVFLYRTPIDSWSERPDEAPDLVTALRSTLNLMSALHRDSAHLWAAHRHEENPRYPYRADQRLGGTDLFRSGSRTVHVVGDTQVAAETREALDAGAVPGWTLQPLRPSVTPLHVLQPLLNTRYYGLLSRNGFSTVEEVEATPDTGLLALRSAGVKFVDAVRTAIADLGLGELAATPLTSPVPAGEAARRRELIINQLEPGPALRNRDFVELLARSSIPATGLRLIIEALNAEPPPRPPQPSSPFWTPPARPDCSATTPAPGPPLATISRRHKRLTTYLARSVGFSAAPDGRVDRLGFRIGGLLIARGLPSCNGVLSTTAAPLPLGRR